MKRLVLKKVKDDNKGSAIVMVVIALAFIAILGVTIMWMSMANFRMKVTDQENKQGFYTAETVLEQIRVGLQGDASLAANSAYSVIMQNYSAWDEAKRESEFKKEFKKSLEAIIQDPSNIGHYSMDHLKGFIDGSINVSIDPGNPGNPRRYMYGTGNIENIANEGWLVLKGITLEYTDDKGFYSEISTDIMISAPSTAFVDTSSFPPVFRYALIADDGLEIGNSPLNVNGSIYVGDGGINTIRRVNLKSDEYIVSKGPLNLGISSDVSVSANVLYASDITVKDGKLNIKSNARVADDLTLMGNTPEVTLTRTYTGFGGSLDDASKSSAIIVNGLSGKLDMSALDNMVVAGRSFIGTKRASEADTLTTDVADWDTLSSNNANIMMGETVAVKGNQLAYLIPDECIGVYNNKTVIGKNPITVTEYNSMISNYYTYQIPGDPTSSIVPRTGFELVAVNKSIGSMGNKMLSDYTGAGAAAFQTIFAPSNGQTLVYFYVKFADNESANRYAIDYYRFHKDKMDRYLEVYADELLLPSSRDKIYTDAGTVSRNATSKGRGEAHLLTTSQRNECSNYEKIYTALCTNLTENMDKLTADQLSKGVYDNIVVSENQIRTFTGNGGTKKFKNAAGNVVAVITDSASSISCFDGNGNSVTANGYAYSGSEISPDLRVIVATHDIVLGADFDGIIIANGKVYIDVATGGSEVNMTGAGEDPAKRQEIIDVLQQLYDPSGADPNATVRPIDFFINGSAYIAGASASGSGLGVVDIENSVIYQNWVKK